MSPLRIKKNWIIGTGFVVLFLLLIAVRLDVLKLGRQHDGASNTSAGKEVRDKESWMNILQNGKKIGYSHRLFARTEKGHHVSESILLQINTMGVVQEMAIKTDGDLNPDMTLASFDLHSSLFRFKAHGVVNGNQVTLYTEMPGSEKKTVLNLKDAPRLANAILESADIGEMRDGETKTVNVFDPATMGQRPVKLTLVGEDVVTIMGEGRKARKVSVDFMGAKQLAWIGDDGSILKEQGILGITMELVTKSQALDGLTLTASADLTQIASVPSNVVIGDASALSMLKVKISSVETGNLKLNGGRQTLKKDVLLIQKETIPARAQSAASVPGNEEFLKATPFIQSDNEKITGKAREIVSPDDPVSVKAAKLVAWVYKNVEKRPVLSVPNAVETLNNLVGDCNEHAVLLAALARAAGIPAQVEVGLVYQKGRFYYHAWNVLFIGTWVTADAVMDQMPADVTHIRFARGEADQQIDLIGVIGKVRLSVLDRSR